jgi:uncharacterized Fe-S cluster-containing protein
MANEIEDIENIFIKTEPFVSEAIEDESEAIEPKKRGRPKRQLTEKQLEALSKGRAKVKENRLKTSQQLKLEQREQKKELTKRQKKALETVRKTKKLDEWDETKANVLSKLPDEDSFNTCKAFLDTLSDEEILNEQKRNEKLLIMCRHIKAKMN